MRIALFDGILEHHLHESLARALTARGHDVLATGRIGHGFRFPAPGAPVEHLERAVDACIAFEPDWLLCFRPASLPPRSLARLRDAGIRLAAWFSDDPVLFDLSYAPVLEQYDRIAHCGGPAVLAHYERYFGRPTGVNLPFWTDRIAFPPVWGTEPAESRAMFLGNVDDAVRRGRYFELGTLAGIVRVHGRVGADHLGLSGGYLDADDEVLVAGARTDWAISIPQRFADHRGLETWFPGLDDLGSFQLPSRIVQCMAMGIPTVSIDPGRGGAELYPELVVVSSAEEAKEVVEDPSWSRERLQERSTAVLARFERHFSAAARAVALEALLGDDERWRELDPDGRSRWFADVVDAAGRDGRPRGIEQDRGAVRAADGAPPLPDVSLVVSDGAEHEEDLVAGLSEVLDEARFDRLTWADAERLSASALRERLADAAVVLCPPGPTRDAALVAAVLALPGVVLAPRGAALDHEPGTVIRFASVDELRTKARRLEGSPLWRSLVADARSRLRDRSRERV